MKKNITVLTAFAALLLLTPGVFALGQKEPELRSYTFFALGTTCTVNIYDGTEEQFSYIEKIVAGIEERMSVNIKDSYISRINESAGEFPVEVPEDVYQVIDSGRAFSELSGGAFDISIGPLVKLWGIGSGGSSVPDAEQISAALDLVDYRLIEIKSVQGGSGKSVFLPIPGMALEPGGIAKGYAADAVAEYIRNEIKTSALINFGGNVLAAGKKADGSKWKIGIQNPDSSRGAYIGIVQAEDRAVVTSGKYERFFMGSDGKRYHHILSTKDGFPVENGIAQVSIIASDSMTADAMSTTVFAMGLEKGLELVNQLEDVEAIIVTEEGSVHLSPGIEQKFKLTDSNFKPAK